MKRMHEQTLPTINQSRSRFADLPLIDKAKVLGGWLVGGVVGGWLGITVVHGAARPKVVCEVEYGGDTVSVSSPQLDTKLNAIVAPGQPCRDSLDQIVARQQAFNPDELQLPKSVHAVIRGQTS